MKALTLHGPWAVYERQAAENERRIGDLEAEVRRLRRAEEDMQRKLVQALEDKQRLEHVDMPALRAEKDRAHGVVDSLQAELAKLRMERVDESRALTEQLASTTAELQKTAADNAVLRSELAKTTHQKQVTNTKLEQIRKKLGLTESEAKAFLQELDDARSASKGMREENVQLAADNQHLKQQVESRSAHCMTLIGENKRLLEQVSELRMQLHKQQGDLWQSKVEQQNAASAVRQLQQTSAARRPQVVVREWTDGQPAAAAAPAVGVSAAAVAAAGAPLAKAAGAAKAPAAARERRSSAGGCQNRPPWGDSRKQSTAGGKQAAQIPIGAAPPLGADAAKAHVVRQALAVRQQQQAAAAEPQEC